MLRPEPCTHFHVLLPSSDDECPCCRLNLCTYFYVLLPSSTFNICQSFWIRMEMVLQIDIRSFSLIQLNELNKKKKEIIYFVY